MVLFFSATLIVSIIGLASLLFLKQYELESGHVFWADVRPKVGAFFHRGLSWLEHVLPALVAQWLREALLYLRKEAKHALAQTMLALERALESALLFMRNFSSPREVKGEVSKFLAEVAEHKKSLLTKKRIKK